MVVYIYNLSTWEKLKQKDFKLEASVGYIARPCLQINERR